MKYCPPCKLRAADRDETCSRCGKPLRTIGAAPTGDRESAKKTNPLKKPMQDTPTRSSRSTQDPTVAAPAPGSDDQLVLRGLEQDLSKSRRKVRLMAVLAAVMAALLIGVLFWLRQSYVMQFAEIDDLQIAPSSARPGTVVINYQPRTEGRLQFVRKNAGRLETLVDHAFGKAPKEFHWAGEDSLGYSVQIRFRDGWSLVDREWRSPVSPEPLDKTVF